MSLPCLSRKNCLRDAQPDAYYFRLKGLREILRSWKLVGVPVLGHYAGFKMTEERETNMAKNFQITC